VRWPWQRSETRSETATTRDLRLVEWFGGGEQRFGQTVNAMRAEWLSAVAASIEAISGTLASLPAYVYRSVGDGRQEDPAHPLADLVRNGWNANLTWPDGVQWWAAECLRHGNALAEKITDAGTVRELRPIPWPAVTAKVLPSGRVVYDGVDPVTRTQRRWLDTEVIHLRDRSDDGLIGRPRHERAHPVIAAALALSEFSGNAFRNGAYPSGTIEADGTLTAEQRAALREQFKEMFSGPANVAKAMILPWGFKWKTATAPLRELELIDARRFAIEEAARLYQVPPPIVGDLSHGTFTNSETLIRFFAMSTVTTWCRKIEAEFHRSIFSAETRRTHHFELDLSGLLRGDPETRWKSHEIALRNRVLTPNEVRLVEGWNPREGGDTFDAPAAGGGNG